MKLPRQGNDTGAAAVLTTCVRCPPYSLTNVARAAQQTLQEWAKTGLDSSGDMAVPLHLLSIATKLGKVFQQSAAASMLTAYRIIIQMQDARPYLSSTLNNGLSLGCRHIVGNLSSISSVLHKKKL